MTVRRHLALAGAGALLVAACADQPIQEQQGMVIGGKRDQVYGTACRQPDGSWRVVS